MQNDTRNARLKAVVETLRGEDFPMDKRDIDYSIGDMDLDGPDGTLVPVRDLTDRLERDSFSSPEEVMRSLQGALHSDTKAA